MKSKFTKILALLLSLVMVLGTLAACDTTEPQQTTDPNAGNQSQPKETDPVETEPQLEPVTLKWMIRASEKEGSEDVEAAFNEKLATVLPNTTIDFVYAGSYGESWTMMLSSEEVVDMAWAGTANPILQNFKDGNILPLDDLIAEYAPNIQADWEMFVPQYATSTYEGQLIAIPNVQPVIKAVQRMDMDAEFYNKYLDSAAFLKEARSNTKLTYKMLDILEDGIEAAIADGHIKPGDLDYSMMSGFKIATFGYQPIGEEKYHLWFDPEAENPEPLHTYEIPEVQMLLDRYAKWYDKGWYTDAEILGTLPSYQKISISFYGAYNGSWAGFDETGVMFNDNSANNNRDTVSILMQQEDKSLVGATNIGIESTYWVIPYTAKNPERAMMLINLLHDEVGTVGNELFNLVANGFAKDSPEHQKYGWFNYAVGKSEDGQDYVDKTARGDAPNMHSVYNWTIANTYRAMFDGSAQLTLESKEYCLKYYEEVYPKLEKTKLANMIFDTSVVSEELDAMLNVEAEYDNQLSFATAGVEGIDELYDKAMAAMYVAGLNIVKVELQDQIDDFIANNK